MRKKIIFYLNGHKRELGATHAKMMLAEYLRYEECLTGTKIVCAEGDCGACTVLRLFHHEKGVDSKSFQPINSCITPVATLDGSSLITVDKLGKSKELHCSQKAMIDNHGAQCGFCTPGFIMAMAGLIDEKKERNDNKITEEDAKNALTGNLCRCTGYSDIINSFTCINPCEEEDLKTRFYSESVDKELTEIKKTPISITADDYIFYAPTKIEDAISFLQKYPDTKIIASGTDLGVVHNKRKNKLTHLLSLHLIESLYEIDKYADRIQIGARVTLNEFRHYLKTQVPKLADYIDIFASPQIKNIATVVGNIANASPIGDMPPALLALEAVVILHGPKGEYRLGLDKFYLDYRKIAKDPDQIIIAIDFKCPPEDTEVAFYKNSNRRDLDISTTNISFKLDWKNKKKAEIARVVIGAGGIATTPIRLSQTEDFLMGKAINSKNINTAIDILHKEFSPISDVRASEHYRRVVIENYFKKFFSDVLEAR